jgi:hypothetical protein
MTPGLWILLALALAPALTATSTTFALALTATSTTFTLALFVGAFLDLLLLACPPWRHLLWLRLLAPLLSHKEIQRAPAGVWFLGPNLVLGPQSPA